MSTHKDSSNLHTHDCTAKNKDKIFLKRSNTGDMVGIVSRLVTHSALLKESCKYKPRETVTTLRYKGIKGKAWEVVKRSVRRREKDCYTCHKVNLIENGIKADSGHYFPVGHQGSNNKLSWHPRLIHLQCSRCNGAGQGMQNEYKAHLIKDYGEEFVEEIHARRYKTDAVKNWQEVIDTFNAL